MIYGRLRLGDWHTALVGGDVPESIFESYNLRLFFYGTLYNRNTLQINSAESNAKIAADVYLKNKISGFRQLDGSYTIVYFSEDECGIVRDHHGTHYPIYCTDEGLYATSWIYLNFHKDRSCELDYSSLSHFLQSGLLPKSSSVLRNVFRLEAGEICFIDSKRRVLETINGIVAPELSDLESLKDIDPDIYNSIKARIGKVNVRSPYFSDHLDYKPFVEKNPDIEAYSHRYGELHQAAIHKRIGNSRHVGILLSGGYDSGANLAALRGIYDGTVDSYSIGFKGDNWTELPLARFMSGVYGTRHHEYEIDGSEISALPDIVDYLGEPFVEGGLMVNYCAMRLVGDDKPDVILGGDGSDQYFGTSAREVALYYLAARSGIRPLLKGMYNMLNNESFDKDGKLYRIRFHLDKILHILDGDRFGYPDFRMREMLQQPKKYFHLDHNNSVDIHSFESLYAQHTYFSDIDISINRVILYKASRMAAMFGNNIAFPYMDAALYQFLLELPVNLKCMGGGILNIARGRGIAKYLLKYHYKPLLPTEITSKKKQGGFAPMPLFFCDFKQRTRLKEFILSSTVNDTFLQRDAVERFLTCYDREVSSSSESSWFWYRQNRALQYFNLLTLAVWWEKFVEKKEVDLK